MMINRKSIYGLLTIIFISCTGEFNAESGAIIALKPDGLCEGGEPVSNNSLNIPFEWSVDKEGTYQNFTVEIRNLDELNQEILRVEVDGSLNQQSITLERGKNYEWKVIGNSSSSTQTTSTSINFYSESKPTLDILPLPSKISSRQNLQSIIITWTNDNEVIDNLNYNVFLSNRIEPNTVIEDASQLSYDQRGTTRSESDEKEEIIPLSSIIKGEYIILIRTIKTENGITNTADSYSRIIYE